MRRKDFAGAIKNFEEAVRLGPGEVAYQLNLQAAQRRCHEDGVKGCVPAK
jgi:hypothetical protein